MLVLAEELELELAGSTFEPLEHYYHSKSKFPQKEYCDLTGQKQKPPR